MLKRMLPTSLFGRTIMIVVVPVVLLQILLAVVFFDRHLDRVAIRLAKSVAGDLNFLIERFNTLGTQKEQQDLLMDAQQNMNMRLAFLPGKKVDLGDRPEATTPLEELLYITMDRGLPDGYSISERTGRKAYSIHVPVDGGALWAIVPFNRFTTSTVHILALWLVGAATIFLGISIIFLRNQVRPIRQLAIAAEKFGRGQDVENYRPSGASEVRQAGAAFQRMSERIDRQVRQRTEMLAGVSHDLKTPLTRMRLELALLGDRPGIEELKTDVAEMEEMIEGYLAFAKGAQGEHVQQVDLAALLLDIVAAAKREGKQIELVTERPLRVECRPQALKRCVTNLVNNAQRFGDHIRLQTERKDNGVWIYVDDDGPGIPPESRKDVFRPFIRLESSRNTGTGGVGLGLAIARDTIRSHGGDITLAESDLGGLRAQVRIPV